MVEPVSVSIDEGFVNIANSVEYVLRVPHKAFGMLAVVGVLVVTVLS